MKTSSSAKRTSHTPCRLGLFLKETEGACLLLRSEDKKDELVLIDEVRFSYSNGWEHLVEDVDEILFQLENDHNCAFSDVIFFIYPHVLDEGKASLKKKYSAVFSKLCSELELTALGYVSAHEAITTSLEKEEGVAPTVCLIEIDVGHIACHIYKRGEVVFQKEYAYDAQTATSGELIAGLESIAKEAKQQSLLPSRLIIYDTDASHQYSTPILTHSWQEGLFVQLPRIDIYTEQKLIHSFVYSFSKQLSMLTHATEEKSKKEDFIPEDMFGFVIGEDQHRPRSAFSFMISFVRTLKNILHVPKRPFTSEVGASTRSHRLIWISSIALVCVGVASVVIVLYFFHKAHLDVYVQSIPIEKELTIHAVQGGSVQDMFVVSPIEEVVTQEKTIETTGHKTIGEKAKGVVTLYNSDTAEKLFKKDTILISSKGIKFLLQTETKVASASQTLTSDGNLLTVTGKAKADVISQEIGEQGNIDKSGKLTIENFSPNLYFGLPENSFTGGSKKEIRTVSKTDLTNLQKQMVLDVKQEQLKEVKEKINTAAIIDSLTNVTLEDEVYSKEVGEEASEVSLKAGGKIVLYTYDEEALMAEIMDDIKKDIPPQRELSTKDDSYVISQAEKKDTELTLTVTFKGKTHQKIDKANLQKDLQWKTVSQLESIIKNTYKGQGYKLEMDTPLSPLRSRLPLFYRNITVRIESL